MRIVQFFSSVGSGDSAYWERLLTEIEKREWDVSEISSLSSSAYRGNTGTLQRWRLRWLMYIAYILKLIRACQKNEKDRFLRVVTTNPFFAPLLVRKLSSYNVIVIDLLYDLYPDALEIAGHAAE